jgi:hypothetical protein
MNDCYCRVCHEPIVAGVLCDACRQSLNARVELLPLVLDAGLDAIRNHIRRRRRILIGATVFNDPDRDSSAALMVTRSRRRKEKLS